MNNKAVLNKIKKYDYIKTCLKDVDEHILSLFSDGYEASKDDLINFIMFKYNMTTLNKIIKINEFNICFDNFNIYYKYLKDKLLKNNYLILSDIIEAFKKSTKTSTKVNYYKYFPYDYICDHFDFLIEAFVFNYKNIKFHNLYFKTHSPAEIDENTLKYIKLINKYKINYKKIILNNDNNQNIDDLLNNIL